MFNIIQPIPACGRSSDVHMDETTGAVERQHAITRFNAPDSLDSVSLICTKGLGSEPISSPQTPSSRMTAMAACRTASKPLPIALLLAGRNRSWRIKES
jgi:hypothetical protein